MNNCSMLSLVPMAGGDRFRVMVGEKPFGFVKESSCREGVYIGYGVSNVVYVGESPREVAVEMLVKESWAAISEPVMAEARKSAEEGAVYVRGIPGIASLLEEFGERKAA